MRAGGALGADARVSTDRAERAFASGDRIMFLKNERGMGVKNGSLGTVQAVNGMRMGVMLDDGRGVAFDLKDYAHVDYGYAATIHKAQGMTVDRVKVLATPGVDSHSTYVALSRHRERVDLYYGRDDFANQSKLVGAASRERGKDMASDYRTLDVRPRVEPKRSIFAGLKLKPTVAIESLGKSVTEPQRDRPAKTVRISASALDAGPSRTALDKAVERYARSQRDIAAMRAKNLSPVAHQRNSLAAAERDLDALHADGAKDLASALRNDPTLISEAANGRTQRAMQAMRAERALRIDAPARADRFVAEWQARSKQLRHHKDNHDYDRAERVGAQLNDMARSLHRDPQLESLLQSRTRELGLRPLEKNSVSQALHDYLNPSRSRGLGL